MTAHATRHFRHFVWVMKSSKTQEDGKCGEKTACLKCTGFSTDKPIYLQFTSVSVMGVFVILCELQHASLPYPSPTPLELTQTEGRLKGVHWLKHGDQRDEINQVSMEEGLWEKTLNSHRTGALEPWKERNRRLLKQYLKKWRVVINRIFSSENTLHYCIQLWWVHYTSRHTFVKLHTRNTTKGEPSCKLWARFN